MSYGVATGTSTFRSRARAALHDPSAVLSLPFLFGAGLVFVRFSMLNEIATYVTGHNPYLLYLFGLPAVIAIVLSGGIPRVVRYRAAQLWLAYGLWGVLAIPFSIWMGGSFHAMLIYWRTELLMVFVVGGLVRSLRECNWLMYTIAAAAAMCLVWTRLFVKETAEGGGRLALEVGTIANSNDFASYILLTLPIILWVVLSSRSALMRLAGLGTFGYGIYVVLASGSRGALVALSAQLLFFAVAGTRKLRVGLFLIAPVVLVVAVLALPSVVAKRLTSFTAGKNSSREALQSSEMRERLLRDAVEAAITHPAFGIGPSQFTLYEGKVLQGSTRGTFWFGAHNSYAQAASESGIPAVLLCMAAIWATFRLLKATAQKCQGDPDLRILWNATFCARLALVGFSIAIFFVNFAWTFHLPAMTGLAIALSSAAHIHEQQRAEASHS